MPEATDGATNPVARGRRGAGPAAAAPMRARSRARRAIAGAPPSQQACPRCDWNS